MTTMEGRRGGQTFDPYIDTDRLNEQSQRVFKLMRDNQWRALHEIAAITGDPEASISARLRDFRKPRFGSLVVNRRRRHEAGLWEYQIAPVENGFLF
jgi:hypothetical protein